MSVNLKELTKRQRSIYQYIVRFIRRKGYPPTVRDIGKGVGLSSASTVHFHLNTLEKKGFIERDPSKPRAIKPLLGEDEDTSGEKADLGEAFPAEEAGVRGEEYPPREVDSSPMDRPCDEVSIPFIEYPIIKGYHEEIPLLDGINVESTIPLPLTLVGEEEGFLLRMQGDSMSGAGINDGDLCIMRPTNAFKDGDIAAVVSNGQLTVKRVFNHMGLYRLEPDNRKMNPVYVKHIKILGKFSGVIRILN